MPGSVRMKVARLAACLMGLTAAVLTGCTETSGSGGSTEQETAQGEARIQAQPAARPNMAPDVAAMLTDTPTGAGTPARGSDVGARAPTAQPISPAATAPPPLAFEPEVLDFGYIKPNTPAKGDIVIRNIGDAPLHILRATPTCQCTTLTNIDGQVLSPGGTTSITARLDGRSMAGLRKASIRLIVEGYSQPAQVDIRAEVSLAVRTTPPIFNLVPPRGKSSGHVVVESIDGQPFSILSAYGREPRFVGYDPEIDEPRNSYVLQWDLSGELEADALPRWWIMETDHPECPLLTTWVRHMSTIRRSQRGAWHVMDKRILLGLMEPGGSAQFTSEVRRLNEDTIYAVRSLSKDVSAKLVELKPKGVNGEVTVEVTVDPQTRGVFEGTLEFIGRQFTDRIDVIGKVVQ